MCLRGPNKTKNVLHRFGIDSHTEWWSNLLENKKSPSAPGIYPQKRLDLGCLDFVWLMSLGGTMLEELAWAHTTNT